MKRSTFISALSALAACASAFTPVTVQEQEFVVGSERFVLLGIDYQPGGASAYGATNTQDPLSNATSCLRDFAVMQALGINVIRSYNVDPTLNHDQCMAILRQAGMYVVLDVNSPLAGQSLDRSNPSGTYTIGYLNHIFSVVQAFKDYDNILGFFAGNEVINDIPTAADAPYIRAIQRDLNNYIAKQASRSIPVGYSAADVREILQDTSQYMQCDNGDNSRSAFFGLNSYSYCKGGNFVDAGYGTLESMFSSSTIPVFFSEYGCNKNLPRDFSDAAAIYGPQMTALSGGLVYEWSEEPDNFGLVNISSDGSIQFRQDFINFSNVFSKINVTQITTTNSTATSLTPPKCNSNLISNSGFSKNFNLPSPPDGAAALISNGVTGISTGKLVSVTQTSVAVPVYNVDGSLVTGLAIKSLSGPNRPGASAFTAGTNTANAGVSPTAAATSSTKNIANVAVATNGAVLGAAIAFAALAL